MLSKRTLAQIEMAIHKTCGHEEGEQRDAGRVLLASAHVGGDATKVAEALGWDVSRVEPYAKRLLKNGIWRKNGKVAANWFHEEEGGLSFALDVAVAVGWIERAKKGRKKSGKVAAV